MTANVPPASKKAQQAVLDTLRKHGQLRLESIAHFSELCHATTHRAVLQLEEADMLFRNNLSMNGHPRIVYGAKHNVQVLPVGNE